MRTRVDLEVPLSVIESSGGGGARHRPTARTTGLHNQLTDSYESSEKRTQEDNVRMSGFCHQSDLSHEVLFDIVLCRIHDFLDGDVDTEVFSFVD